MKSILAMVGTLALVTSFIGGCSSWSKSKEPPKQTGYVTKSFMSSVHNRRRDYGLVIPRSYNDNPKKKWPTILFLHGFGEKGDVVDLAALKHGPLKEAQMKGDSEFIIIAPQMSMIQVGEARTAWRKNEPDLMKILADVKSEYRVDESRLYLTGMSMGGFGSFMVAADHPGMFAAVAPICGGGDVQDAVKYGKTPFWIFHGEKDPVVNVQASKNMLGAMKEAGCEVKITLYPNALHDAWTETYQNADLYAWMLAHQSPSK